MYMGIFARIDMKGDKMRTSSIYNEGQLRLYLSGELDHHAAKKCMSEIERKIDCYLPRDCVLDMGELKFMDSSGIAVIIKTMKRMKELDGRMWVENAGEQPMRVIDASGIDRIVRICAVKE